jgi:hypothetical protein
MPNASATASKTVVRALKNGFLRSQAIPNAYVYCCFEINQAHKSISKHNNKIYYAFSTISSRIFQCNPALQTNNMHLS